MNNCNFRIFHLILIGLNADYMVYESLAFHIHLVSMLLSPLKHSPVTEMIILRSTMDNPVNTKWKFYTYINMYGIIHQDENS